MLFFVRTVRPACGAIGEPCFRSRPRVSSAAAKPHGLVSRLRPSVRRDPAASRRLPYREPLAYVSRIAAALFVRGSLRIASPVVTDAPPSSVVAARASRVVSAAPSLRGGETVVSPSLENAMVSNAAIGNAVFQTNVLFYQTDFRRDFVCR